MFYHVPVVHFLKIKTILQLEMALLAIGNKL